MIRRCSDQVNRRTVIVLILMALLSAPPQVGRDGAVLRAGCEPGSGEIARLAAGTAVSIRFSMNGEGGVDRKSTRLNSSH